VSNLQSLYARQSEFLVLHPVQWWRTGTNKRKKRDVTGTRGGCYKQSVSLICQFACRRVQYQTNRDAILVLLHVLSNSSLQLALPFWHRHLVVDGRCRSCAAVVVSKVRRGRCSRYLQSHSRSESRSVCFAGVGENGEDDESSIEY
jgi:hypothetical protein